MSTLIHGTFVSVWENGQVETEATLNMETGEVEAKYADVDGDLGCLDEEYFLMPNGEDRLEICPECHTFILHSYMENDDTGKGLHDVKECRGKCQE